MFGNKTNQNTFVIIKTEMDESKCVYFGLGPMLRGANECH